MFFAFSQIDNNGKNNTRTTQNIFNLIKNAVVQLGDSLHYSSNHGRPFLAALYLTYKKMLFNFRRHRGAKLILMARDNEVNGANATTVLLRTFSVSSSSSLSSVYLP